ncbi:transcriptional repressor [Duganella zoogloeoides]|uniref:Transcriptional repressor n=1 Tax=Duganella zoogloeoides TaxID=75659 RepID=A0ABZ0Y4U8_9BURK|nr:transcriptional repressor [Duganella zoogloeoides]WQH07077.1 transcriptional repressor [Duganella zoogloeoides]
MTKKLYGVVFASAADAEYEGMAHVWVRDANTAHWFSLSRAVESDCIEVMVSDQLSCYDEVNVTLSKTGILVRLNDAGTQSLDGHHEYSIEFHPESVDIAEIRETLEVIFRGKSGLLLHV